MTAVSTILSRRIGGVAAPASQARARLSRGDVFFYLVFAFFALASLIRSQGALLYMAILSVCVVYVVMRRGWVSDSTFLAFCFIGAFYALGSYARMFPAAWTVVYDASAIPQQSIFVVGFYFFVAAGRVFWSDLLVREDRILRLWMLMVSGFVAPLAIGVYWGDLELEVALKGFFCSLSNPAMMGYLSLGLLVLVCYERRARVLAVVLTPFMAVFTPFTQNTFAALAFLALTFAPWPRALLRVMVSAVLLMWVVGFESREILTAAHPTWTVRINFAADALEALRQNLGVGVGFGTEAVTPVSLLGAEAFASGMAPWEFDEGWIYISIHNSFVATFFRLGILGGVSFLIVFFAFLFPAPMRDIRLERVACFTYFVLFLVIFSNPGLESAAYHVGAGFAAGLLLSLRRHAQIGAWRGPAPARATAK